MAFLDQLIKRKSCCSDSSLVPVDKTTTSDKKDENKSDKCCDTCC